MNAAAARESERLRKTNARMADEVAREIATLRARADYHAGYDYFLELLAGGITPAALEKRTGKPAVNLLCVQAPLELIYAAGFLPCKLFSGSFQADTLGANSSLPALMCPMLRAVQGVMRLTAPDDDSRSIRPVILPTTCDWIVKLPEMLRASGREKALAHLHWLELPHFKETAAARERWLTEVMALRTFLERTAGEKIDRRGLTAAMLVYSRAWKALSRLEEVRQDGVLPLLWFLVITNSFFLDAPERWTEAVNTLLTTLATHPLPRPDKAAAGADNSGGKVFLAGSPIFFPNFKLPHLLDEAGLTVVADDLCSSSRIFPGGAPPRAGAVFDLLVELAGRYHEGCICPTFADNDRRINNIAGRAERFAGVVFHVLKGCHPYDLESCLLEDGIRRRGLKFLRLETDYATEDSRTLLTRLEAFRQTL